ncbi:MAG: omptin family outer membrane protease [Kiritimatiellae bacterium]|nr:omptin family outer membrane protease [Kiritimatiellia bacterium]
MNHFLKCVLAVVCALAALVIPARALPLPLIRDTPGEEVPRERYSVRAIAATIGGEARELVYGPTHKLSELIWDIDGVSMAGLALNGRWGAWAGYAGCVVAVSEGRGQMRDYDWQIPGFDWTDYSLSYVDVDSAWTADAGVTVQLVRMEFLSLRAMAGLRVQHWSWSDRGREYIYSEEGFRDTRGVFDGRRLIEYEQSYVVPYLGAQAHGGGDRWAWSGYLALGPQVWAEDWDHHVARDLRFEGDFSGGVWVGAGATLEWKWSPHWSAAAGAHLQSIPEFKGDLHVVEIDERYTQSAGISLDTFMVDLSLNCRW